jgi:hypothetical protein
VLDITVFVVTVEDGVREIDPAEVTASLETGS